ncbi:hypothetical protein [Clostridium celatum]|nr:hypothetical protein [Clostridium celatum]MCE9654317.1 hypothetical protein [Clostridium celatum]
MKRILIASLIGRVVLFNGCNSKGNTEGEIRDIEIQETLEATDEDGISIDDIEIFLLI